MGNKLISISKFFIGWPLTIVALFFLGNLIFSKFQEILPYIKTPTLPLLIPSVLVFVVFFFLRALTWHKLLNFHKFRNITFKDTCLLWGTAELKRFIPGYVWSYLGKTASFSKRGVSKEKIANMLVTEITLIIVSGFIVSLLSIPLISRFLVFNNYQIFLINILVAILTVIYIFGSRINFPKPIKYMLPGFNPGLNFTILTISCVSVFMFGLGTYLAISSVIYLPIEMALSLVGFFALSFLLSYLAIIAPMGLGVREGFITLGLSKITKLELAGFSSIFARIILIFSEILFLLIVFIWHNTNGKLTVKLEKLAGDYWREIILTIMVLVYIFYFTLASFLRYDNFFTGRFDLGNMTQIVWNTAGGKIFLFTNPDGTNIISRLSYHADFLLILLSPFYLLWESPKMLLFIQTLVLAFGAFFIYLIARDVIKNKSLALVLSIAYLLNPSVQYSNLYDFHPVTLATTFLLGAFYFLRKKNYVWFIVFLILSCISKEQVWIISAIFGIYIFIVYKKRLLGGIIAAGSLIIFYTLVAYIIPNLREGQHFALSYYSEFGDSPLIIMKNILLSPGLVIKSVFSDLSVNYLFKLFLPLGFLSLLSPLALIFALPDLVINLLSNNTQLKQIYYQYTAIITPFMFITAIFGIKFASRKLKKLPLTLFSWYLVVFAILGAYLYGPLPASQKPSISVFTEQLGYGGEVDEVLRKIPQDAKVAATNNLGSHLSQRDYLFTIPIGVEEADYVALLLNDPFAQPSLAAQENFAESLRNNPNYQLMYEKEDFLIFKKLKQ